MLTMPEGVRGAMAGLRPVAGAGDRSCAIAGGDDPPGAVAEVRPVPRGQCRPRASPTGPAQTQPPFQLDVDTHVFSKHGLRRLREYGGWLKALSSGALVPRTPEQRRFVEAVQAGEATTDWERLWRKYLDRREFEELRRATPRYRVTDGAEDWFPRAAWRRGVHFPRRAAQ